MQLVKPPSVQEEPSVNGLTDPTDDESGSMLPEFVNYLFILLVGVGVTLLVSRLKARLGGIVGLAIIAFIGATGLILFLRYSSWIWVLSPTVAALLAYSGSTVALYLAEIQEKARIRGMFQQYVSTSVVNELIAHPELLSLGGEERELTVLFCDVADFTRINAVFFQSGQGNRDFFEFSFLAGNPPHGRG